MLSASDIIPYLYASKNKLLGMGITQTRAEFGAPAGKNLYGRAIRRVLASAAVYKMKTCRICLEEEGEMIQPCLCKGTTADVHPECLHRWLMVSREKRMRDMQAPYEMEDVVEFKWKLNPSCSVSDTSSTIVYLCCMLKFMMQTFALLSDYDPMFVLFTSNAADVFFCTLFGSTST